MKQKMFLVFVMIAFFTVSCDKGEDIPTEPEKTYKGYRVYMFSDDPQVHEADYCVLYVYDPINENIERWLYKEDGKDFKETSFILRNYREDYVGKKIEIEVIVTYNKKNGGKGWYHRKKSFVVTADPEPKIFSFTVP
ncbi:hypothetical protein K9M50_03060 [Patescibacteria group bacterium]|nr:hypothetical protein [Patescibacteria group bacterium]